MRQVDPLACNGSVGRLSSIRVRLENLTYLPALALMFLVSFQEFELASLIGRPAWTVWLFDAQVGGLVLSESLRKTVLPVLCQIAVLIPPAALILTTRTQPDRETRLLTQVDAAHERIVSWCAAICRVLALARRADVSGRSGNVQRAVARGAAATQARMLFYEIFTGLGYAAWLRRSLCTFVSASLLGATCAARFGWRPVYNLVTWHPRVGRFARAGIGVDTTLAAAAAAVRLQVAVVVLDGIWSCCCCPRALLVRFFTLVFGGGRRGHAARLLGESPSRRPIRGSAGELLWQMRWRAEFWGVAVLAYWGFFDLTTASLLAPVTIVSAPVMLYNQMHFGKNAILSAALVLLTVLVPLGVFGATVVARPLVFRLFWR